MSQARYIVGDVFDGLAKLPDASVDLVVTSPPFLALRSYLPAEHPDKGKEIGSEGTPGAFMDALLDVVVELRRVLAPHGSLCVELGDTYAGSGGAGGDYTDGGLRDGQPAFPGSARTARASSGWPDAKSLCMVPSTFAWALSYGLNPWTGRTLARWRVRNLIAWCRPNPPVGALGDKFRPATSYMTVACMGGKRYFDLDAVREPPTAGAPPLDYWEVTTKPYKGSHYATMPPGLCIRPVLAMSPLRVCRTCGKPSERVTERTPEYVAFREQAKAASGSGSWESAVGNRAHGFSSGASSGSLPPAVQSVTTGWTDCGHDDWRPGVVLDPFAGSGTTLAVATGHGRDAVGIDLDERNAQLALERVGPMLLTVERA